MAVSRSLVEQIRALLNNPLLFVERGSGLKLRQYQEAVARTVVESVREKRGLSIVVVFPRQSGKNELQAQIETYLLTLYSELDGEIIKISPTWKPQSLNAMRRLERVLSKNLITRTIWKSESGYIFKVNRARIFFLSGSPEANIVGATASTLLEVDEAQDILPSKFDKDIAPMAASTNATRVFWGTAWTSQTLLGRELRAAREAERRDGLRRVFVMTAENVAAEVPEYGAFVAEQVAKMGRNHPMVRTQFFSEEIDAEGGMFPPERVAMMKGSHPALAGPQPSRIFAGLLDVAGEDESVQDEDGEGLSNPRRDSTALTIVEVDLSTLADPVIKLPTYRVVQRRAWIGVKHSRLYAEIKALADAWRMRFLAVDSTGVGAGLASFLDRALPGRVLPFVFTGASKSQLGWDYLAVIDSGRWKEPGSGAESITCQQALKVELEHCLYEILPGPGKLMRWGVPDGTRDHASGDLVHDDLVISGALAAVLDEQEWSTAGPALVVQRKDVLKEIENGY